MSQLDIVDYSSKNHQFLLINLLDEWLLLSELKTEDPTFNIKEAKGALRKNLIDILRVLVKAEGLNSYSSIIIYLTRIFLLNDRYNLLERVQDLIKELSPDVVIGGEKREMASPKLNQVREDIDTRVNKLVNQQLNKNVRKAAN